MNSPIPFPDRQQTVAGGNGGSNDARIRAIELDVREIKTRTENMATKNDIDKLKLWVAGSALFGALSIIGWLVVLVSRLLAAASAGG